MYFTHNRLGGVPGPGLTAPDSVVTAANGAQVVYQDNQFYGGSNGPPTSGITTILDAAPVINLGGAHTIGINASTTPITTIQSTLGPGETTTLLALGGSITLAGGGNIGLLGSSTLSIMGTITLVRTDIPGSQQQWWPISQWTASSTGGTSGMFSLSYDPQENSIEAGNTAIYNLTLRAGGHLREPVQFMCAGAPFLANCVVSPNSIALSPNTPVTSSVSVFTTSSPVSTSQSRNPRFGLVASALSSLAMFVLPFRLHHGLRAKIVSSILLLFLVILATGCGNGVRVPPKNETPKGKYPITVTARTGTISRSVVLTLNVI